MELLNNYVRVSGIGLKEVIGDLQLDVSYRPEVHTYGYGRVEQLGAIGFLDTTGADGYYVHNQVLVGDLVFIRWTAVDLALRTRDLQFGGDYLIDYNSIVCIVRDDIIPVNGYVLFEGDRHGGIVRKISSDLDYYLDYEGNIIDLDLPCLGDTIVVRRHSAFDVEYKFHQEMGCDYYAVQTKDIKIWTSRKITRVCNSEWTN
jgi:hypothetical protein